jgi:NAD(P)-dependent dehydrogenase (short-subunit alcohol dehydrogenase family)
VTGGNRGIGLEVAKQLAQTGTCVILSARDIKQGEEAAKAFPSGNRAFPTELDVTNEATIKRLEHRVSSKFGRLDILVNNAGVLIDESDLPTHTKTETIRTTLETNLLGPWRLCQTFIPLMKKNKAGVQRI